MRSVFLRLALSAAFALSLSLTPSKAADTKPADPKHADAKPAVSAAEALTRLKDGNARFVAGKPVAKDLAQQRNETAKGQKPFAIILTCADSRVSPELVFDQGIGDVFVLRVAGNVTDPAMLGSIEYAVEHLHTLLIVVLGHEKCGAVGAAVEGGHAEGNLAALIKRVHIGDKPAPGTSKDAAIAAGVRANALYHAAEMTKNSTTLKDFAGSGRIQIVAGVYAIDTGKIEWLTAEKKPVPKKVEPKKVEPEMLEAEPLEPMLTKWPVTVEGKDHSTRCRQGLFVRRGR
jgi:carbonic anhydrase